MQGAPLLDVCPICEQEPLAAQANDYVCAHCGLRLTAHRGFLGLGPKDRYRVLDLGAGYDYVRGSVVNEVFSLTELRRFRETVYSDAQLDAFAEGDLTSLNMPASTLAQILLEQLRETCYLHVDHMRRALGPPLPVGGNRWPQEAAPKAALDWKDEGNLFLTNVRVVLPSDTFTFIRLDRRLVGLKTFTDGIAVQERNEDQATYFVGCRPHEAMLLAAYVTGRVPKLRSAPEAT